jgi:hypothetical protein
MHVTGLKPSLPGSRALFIEDIFGDTVSLGALDCAPQEVPLPAPRLSLGGYVIEGGEVHAFDLNMRRFSTSLDAEHALEPVIVPIARVSDYCRPCAKDQ